MGFKKKLFRINFYNRKSLSVKQNTAESPAAQKRGKSRAEYLNQMKTQWSESGLQSESKVAAICRRWQQQLEARAELNGNQ